MRLLIPLAAWLACTASVSAQVPPARAGKLDDYLARWEAAMDRVASLSFALTRVDTDRVFQTQTRYTGWAAYRKSGTGLAALEKAALELRPDGEEAVSEKIVFNGTHVTWWATASKTIFECEVRQADGGEAALPLWIGSWFGKKLTAPVSWELIVGMKAATAKERFALVLAKEDAHYIYVDVSPKKVEDKAEFQSARLVLDRKTFLPRQLWLREPNGNESLWDMPRSATALKLAPGTFAKPVPEQGWTIVPLPKARPGGAGK